MRRAARRGGWAASPQLTVRNAFEHVSRERRSGGLFAVGENALAGIVLGYGGIAITDIQEGHRSIGEMLRPIGARRDDHTAVARLAYVVAVNANRSAE